MKDWFRAEIPKAARIYIRVLAQNRLGMRYRAIAPNQSNKQKVKKHLYGSNRGKWMLAQGQFYFRTESNARLYEQEATMWLLKGQTDPLGLLYFLMDDADVTIDIIKNKISATYIWSKE